MILLVAAVPLETALIRQELNLQPIATPLPLALFTDPGQRVALLHCGVGKSNAAASLALALTQWPQSPEAVLSLGCAGAYPGSDLTVGDLALVTEEFFGDEGVDTPGGFLDMEAMGLPLAQHPAPRFNRFELDGKLARWAAALLEKLALELGCGFKQGTAATVSCCSGTDHRASQLRQRTGALCESMEGAALAQLCLRMEVPLMQLRGISNLAEDRDMSRWDLKGGVEIAQIAALKLLQHWPQRI